MPMTIEMPNTLAALTQAIDGAPSDISAKAAVKQAKAAIAEYDKVDPEKRAEFVHIIRNEIAELKQSFNSALNEALAEYPGNTDPTVATEIAHLAVQAGRPDVAQRLVADAQKHGEVEGDMVEVQQQVLDTPTEQTSLIAELTAPTAAPSSARDLNLMGLELLAKEDNRGAKSAFECALDLDPGNPEILNNYALTLIQSGLVRQGADAAIEALTKQPSLSPANLILATASLEFATDWAKQ